jgi:hypothetical protein
MDILFHNKKNCQRIVSPVFDVLSGEQHWRSAL